MITVTLPMPDRNLSFNRIKHWYIVAKGREEQRELALARGAMALAAAGVRAPFYPSGLVSVSIDVERKARGKVWDAAALVEATKGYIDGFNEVIYTDDAQIRSFAVRWDTKPTGNGLIHLYIRALSESQGWPVVAWATEEWR